MAIRCCTSSTSCLGANVLYIFYNAFNFSVLYSSNCDVINHFHCCVNNKNRSYVPFVSAIWHVLDGDRNHFYSNEIASVFLQQLCCD